MFGSEKRAGIICVQMSLGLSNTMKLVSKFILATFYFPEQTRHLISLLPPNSVQATFTVYPVWLCFDSCHVTLWILWRTLALVLQTTCRAISFDQYCEENSRSHCDEHQTLNHTFLGWTKCKISSNLISFVTGSGGKAWMIRSLLLFTFPWAAWMIHSQRLTGAHRRLPRRHFKYINIWSTEYSKLRVRAIRAER